MKGTKIIINGMGFWGSLIMAQLNSESNFVYAWGVLTIMYLFLYGKTMGEKDDKE